MHHANSNRTRRYQQHRSNDTGGSITPLLMVLLLACNIEAFSPSCHYSLQRGPLSYVGGRRRPSTTTTTSALGVWWFGGSNTENPVDDESCELVAVRIERLSPNSRRIGGDITVDAPLEDVWAILTDYDNLSTHVPNLVASNRVESNARTNRQGTTPGDGDYRCRLYQRGAQKIVGFEFGASVTMDMEESVVSSPKTLLLQNKVGAPQRPETQDLLFPEEKRINFKCVESQFFSEFDGEWKVTSSPNNDATTIVSYIVDVRPKGPVPVGALEWRIREDVPTNLRAVKKAAQEVGLEGVLSMRNQNQPTTKRMKTSVERIEWDDSSTMNKKRRASALDKGRDMVRNAMNNNNNKNQQRNGDMIPLRVAVSWDENETMAAYLDKQ